MSGFVGDLSPEQETMLTDIKLRMVNNKDSNLQAEIDKLDDSMILRFLRARKWKLEDSYNMLMEALVFRSSFQERGVDCITEDTVENELKCGKSFFHGSDKEGRPICVVRTRKHDSSQRDLDEAQRYIVYVMETGKELLPEGIETCTLIFDMSSFSTKNMDYPLCKFMVEMFQKYYPESLSKCFILNAPWMFMGIWSIIKHWMDPYTVSKINFVKSKQLLDYISPEQLLTTYGGHSKFKYSYKGITMDD